MRAWMPLHLIQVLFEAKHRCIEAAVSLLFCQKQSMPIVLQPLIFPLKSNLRQWRALLCYCRKWCWVFKHTIEQYCKQGDSVSTEVSKRSNSIFPNIVLACIKWSLSIFWYRKRFSKSTIVQSTIMISTFKISELKLYLTKLKQATPFIESACRSRKQNKDWNALKALYSKVCESVWIISLCIVTCLCTKTESLNVFTYNTVVSCHCVLA